VILGEGTVEVNQNAFYNCTNLKTIYIHKDTDEALLKVVVTKLGKEDVPDFIVKYTDIEEIPA
ncbi:MAG: leucine-rich repeat domain-containing protein, partial [Firmicutes bacterium]|nr:leucine-rich repeat domain-containing protein [Bacillota bacterium]